MIALAAIAPHGDVWDAPATLAAMEELGRRHAAAEPEATVVFTPHGVHLEGHFAVVVAGALAGEEEGHELSCPVDRALAADIVAALRGAGLPALGVSFGSNDPELAVMPVDWGALVPLAFMAPRAGVVVSPARDRPLAEHARAGAAVAAAAGQRRVAVVASADHGHRHDPEGPFGFDPASAEYDRLAVELVREGRLDRLAELAPLAGPAWADSLWQLAMLDGAVPGAAFELLSYEAPTYYGMLCAAVT